MGKNGDGVYEGYYKPHLNPRNNSEEFRKAQYAMMYQRVLMELCANRFKWHNLPETVDERFLELELMRKSLVVMIHDDTYGYLALRATPQGGVNMYDNPIQYNVYGNRYVNKTVEAKDCVPIWANYLRQPDWDIIELYSSRLAEIERTREITGVNMRQNRVIIADENTKHSMTQVNRQINAGQTTIYGAPGLDLNAIQAIDTGVHPETLPKMAVDRSQVWNDCMTLLGINNANQDKRERLVADEVEANDEQVDTFKRVALNARQQAADEMSKKFDIDVWVEFATPEDMRRQVGTVDTEISRMESTLEGGN